MARLAVTRFTGRLGGGPSCSRGWPRSALQRVQVIEILLIGEGSALKLTPKVQRLERLRCDMFFVRVVHSSGLATSAVPGVMPFLGMGPLLHS